MGIEDEDDFRQHKLVMYTSPDLLQQYFRRYSDDISKRVEVESESTATEFSGGIGGVLGSLKGMMKKKSGKELIEEINLNDEYRQVRALMNAFSDSSLVSSVESLKQGNKSPTGLYRFDTNLQLVPTEEMGEHMISVRGIEDSVDFSGITSTDNWSSRSFVSTAVGVIDPFPFEGVFMPVETRNSLSRETKNGYEVEQLELTVKFLYILAPDTEDYNNWSNYQKLVRDHPKDVTETGVETDDNI